MQKSRVLETHILELTVVRQEGITNEYIDTLVNKVLAGCIADDAIINGKLVKRRMVVEKYEEEADDKEYWENFCG